jgi:hypothetical protein
MKLLGFTLALELLLMGYVIGKYDLDEIAIAALKRHATDAIAYAKAIPPATIQPVLPGLKA